MSGQGRLYKPKVKASGAQRESEGVVVPLMGVQNNTPGGKGPCFSQASQEGKRKGMTQTAGSNYPDGREPIDKVRKLQRKLYATAKQQVGRRFHALYNQIHRSDVLWQAWERVRRNRGAAGVDAMTLEAVREYGVERLLAELRHDLRTGKYRPQPVLRRYIPKGDGKKRPLGIPTVKDRVAQAATKLVLEPIFEADFKTSSYGFRPRRSTTQALESIRELANRGYNHVLDADIRDYFGSIDQKLLMERIQQRVSDRKVLKLLRGWLRAGVVEDGRFSETASGTPQGGVISPLLSNIYLHFLDAVWQRQCADVGVLVRYADDFVVMCESAKLVEEAKRRVGIILGRLRLDLNPEKTRKVDLSFGKEGFDFLGCHLRKRLSGRLYEKGLKRYFLQRCPSARSMKRIRQKVKDLTGSERNGVKDVRVLIKDLNPVLHGWGNHFRTGNAAIKFNSVDGYVRRRLFRFQTRRVGRNLKPGQAMQWNAAWFEQQGLYRLGGTIRYPNAVHAVQ
jgi:group II intron reverse transcriptase/maturase